VSRSADRPTTGSRGADAGAEGAPRRFRDERVRPPADGDAKLAFLRKVFEEGKGRGWKLISATREPGGEDLLVTWDTSE